MNTGIISDEVADAIFDSIDIDTILKMALQERDAMIAKSTVMQEFQQDIDKIVNGFRDVTKRLESLALAARTFNIKREIPEKIAQLEKSMVFA